MGILRISFSHKIILSRGNYFEVKPTCPTLGPQVSHKKPLVYWNKSEKNAIAWDGMTPRTHLSGIKRSSLDLHALI